VGEHAAHRDRPVLSVVIVTFRRPELVESCLRSVRAGLGAFGAPAEVVVVDNGSQDETGDLIRADFPEARLLTIEQNVGFTPAVMRGIRTARGDWIALLNDDVTVDPRAFRLLVEAGGADPSVGAVAAQMRFADRPDVINSAGIEIDRLGVAADRLLGALIGASEQDPVEVFGVSGGAALYRRAMLDELGGFDESFFAYLEDVDLAWRARMHGWHALYVPAAVAYHHHSATLVHGSPQKYFLVGRNRVRLLAKNATAGQLARYGAGMVAYDAAYILYVAIRGGTVAPLRGRLRGLREWRAYRNGRGADRKSVELAPVLGLRHALKRNRAWASSTDGASQTPRGDRGAGRDRATRS